MELEGFFKSLKEKGVDGFDLSIWKKGVVISVSRVSLRCLVDVKEVIGNIF